MSRIQHEVTRTLTRIQEGGRMRFLAPELFNSELFRTSTKSDVYSLAMVFLALITQEKPFAETTNAHKAFRRVMDGSRPIRPATLPFSRPVNDQVWSLMEHMWAQDPMNRPSAPFVVTALKEIFTLHAGVINPIC